MKRILLTILALLVSVGVAYGGKVVDLPLSSDLIDKKGTLAAGEIKRVSAATYIDIDGVLQTADGDDTPFSNASVENETGVTDMRGSFVDGQAWWGGEILGADLVIDSDFSDWTADDLDNWLELNADASEDDGGAMVTASSGPGLIYQSNIVTVGGKLYHLRLSYKNTAGDVAEYRIYDLSNGSNIVAYTTLPDSVIATTKDIYFTTPAGCISVRLYLGGVLNGDIVWFYEATIQLVTSLSTQYADTGDLLIIDDTAAKGYGFIGEVGTGETLSAEVLADPTLEDAGEWDDSDANVTQNAGAGTVTWDGLGGGNFLTTAGAGQFTVGKLYKIAVVIDSITAGSVYIYDGLAFEGAPDIWATPGIKTTYRVCTSDGNFALYGNATSNAVISNISVKEVTEPSANAVHIYKEYSLTTEGWNSIATDINYNADTTWDFDVYVNLLSSSGSTAQARFEADGLLIEEEGTNWLLYSRDLSNAVWAKTSCTGTKNQVGLDGNTNSASLLTATGANATALQTLSLPSAANTFSVYVKRSVGTGTISITDNNGANYTECTSLSSTTFTKYEITRTQANPVVGFKIATSTDAIIIDYAQLEQTAFSTSRIPTAAIPVTRTSEAGNASDNGYSWTVPVHGVLDSTLSDAVPPAAPTDANGTLTFDVKWGMAESVIAAADNGLLSVNDLAQGLAYFDADSFDSHDSTNESNYNHPAFVKDAEITYAVRWGDVDGNTDDISVGYTADAGTTWVFDATPASFDTDWGVVTDLRLGIDLRYPIHIKNIAFYDVAYTQAQVANLGKGGLLLWMIPWEFP